MLQNIYSAGLGFKSQFYLGVLALGKWMNRYLGKQVRKLICYGFFVVCLFSCRSSDFREANKKTVLINPIYFVEQLFTSTSLLSSVYMSKYLPFCVGAWYLIKAT